jgi:hypothetical protein
MKGAYLPGVVPLVSEAQGLRGKPNNDPTVLELVKRFDHQYALRTTYKQERKRRLGLKMSTEEYESIRATWIRGVYEESTIAVSCVHRRLNTAWRPPGIYRINRVISELEETYGAHLPVQNGAPWLCFEGHVPRG